MSFHARGYIHAQRSMFGFTPPDITVPGMEQQISFDGGCQGLTSIPTLLPTQRYIPPTRSPTRSPTKFTGCVWGATDPSDSKPMADIFDCDPVPAQDCHSASCVTDPITTGLNARLGSISSRFDGTFTFGRSTWTEHGLAYLQTGSDYNAEEGCLAALGPLNQVLQLTAQEMATCSQDRAGCSDSPDANECPGFACCGNRLAHSPSGDRDKHMAMVAHWATTPPTPPTGQPTAWYITSAPSAEPTESAPGVKTCNVMGPSYYTAGGQRIPGQDWPISLGATAAPQDCADRCAALLACNGYHFYGSQESPGAGTCYLWQGVTGVQGPLHDARD